MITEDIALDHDVEDMTKLVVLDEMSILENLRLRYTKCMIYTYTGTILVALNPYQELNVYNPDYVNQYRKGVLHELPPHIFAIAETTYTNISSTKSNQTVIISGESGAGKTESTKFILQYLTAITSVGNHQAWLEQQILEANTILEAFGNAKTTRNNNSSRFGKFVQINFDKSTKIIGASIINYLLEKSRIVGQAKAERNYHIFYMLLAGSTLAEKSEWHLLNSASDYSYLNVVSHSDMGGMDDKKNFEDLKLAFTVLKISVDQMKIMFKVLSAILLLGNIEFEIDSETEKVQLPSNSGVETIAHLLSCDASQLEKALCARQMTIRGETSVIGYSHEQALDNRDSIAKAIYNNLFQYIVDYINLSTAAKGQLEAFIGVLDIFGFEAFEKNSFEQLCINYTNEKLQQFFNQFIFKLEQEEYTAEGIPWASITYNDNSPCIEMIEGKLGLLSLLDEECRIPKGTDESFLSKISDALTTSDYFVRSKTAKGCFGIKHYAGEVVYQVKSFLEKNKSAVQDEIIELFKNSDCELVRELFAFEVLSGGEGLMREKSDSGLNEARTTRSRAASCVLRKDTSSSTNTTNGKGPKKQVTAGNRFKEQLNSLVSTLALTTPHYVRCIKTNTMKKPFVFEDDLILSQLRYSGMLETICIRKSGFPKRFSHEQFVSRFRYVLPAKTPKAKKIAESCFNILKTLGSKYDGQYYLGKTKVFMKDEINTILTENTNKVVCIVVVKIQKVFRGHAQRKSYREMKNAAQLLQAVCKLYIHKKIKKQQLAAALKIQSAIRGWWCRDLLRQMKAEKTAEAARLAKIQERERMAALQESGAQEELAKLKEEKAAENVVALMAKHVKKVTTVDGDNADPNAENSTVIDNLFSFLEEFDTNDPAPIQAKMGKMSLSNTELAAKGSQKNVLRSNKNLGHASKHNVDMDSENITPNMPISPISPISPHGMKNNPLGREFRSKENLAEEFKYEDYPLSKFGQEHFEEHVDSTNTYTYNKKNTLTLEQMTKYNRIVIPTSMLKHSEERFVSMSVEFSKNLALAMETILKGEELTKVRKLIEVGLTNAEMRDEIYVQICRQTTFNEDMIPKSWETIMLNGWIVMAACCISFAPSQLFSKYLQAYLLKNEAELKNSEDKNAPIISAYISFCLSSLRAVALNGSRKVAPSIKELTFIADRLPKFQAINLPDGQTKNVEMPLSATVGELIQEFASKIGLKDILGWSLYYRITGSGEEFAVKNTEYVGDLFCIRENADPKLLFLRKRIFKNPLETSSDPVEYNLLYSQFSSAVLADEFLVSEKTSIQLAALKAQVMWGDYDPSQHGRFDKLEDYLPASVIPRQSPAVWRKAISELHAQLIGKSQLQAKVIYMETVKQFKLYGSSMFKVGHNGPWIHPEQIILAIAEKGISFVHPKTRAILESFPGSSILYWDSDKQTVTIELKVGGDDEDDIMSHTFTTAHAEDINMSMTDYFGATRIAPQNRATKAKKIALDSQMLEIDVQKARDNLSASKAIRLPGPSYYNSQVKNAGKLSTITKTLRRQQSSFVAGEPVVIKNEAYTKEDWIFGKYKLVHSLLASEGGYDIDDQAIDIWSSLQNFSGLVSASAPKQDNVPADAFPYSEFIQETMALAIDNNKFAQELYLQLIKQTTDHPEPDSKYVVRYWKFFAFVCASVIPRNDAILEYVKAHLRRYAHDSKIAAVRPIEAQHAVYCFRIFSRLLLNKDREFPPSCEEIKMVMNLKDLCYRFRFQDGTFRALLFDPMTIARDACALVLDKMKMKECEGFAIFEKYGDLCDEKIDPETKLTDVMFKWEKQGLKILSEKGKKDKNFILPDLQFYIRKRIYINPLEPCANEMEENLVMNEALAMIQQGYVPVTFEEAVQIAALRCQLDYGDQNFSKLKSYENEIAKYFSRQFVLENKGLVKMLEKEHGGLKGMPPTEVKIKMMQVIRQWKYHGSAVFDVEQSYTDAMPRKLYLAVNHEGIHLFAPGDKEPLTSHFYKSIVSFSPSNNFLMIVTQSSARGSKYVFTTNQALAISNLMNDYVSELSKRRKAAAAVNKQ